jgi:TRAP-type mannitol/chloroaromatic compound transport system permease small subunit
MPLLLLLSRTIDWFTEKVGRLVAWFVLVAVLVSAVNAIIRKLFDISSNSWLELQWVLFGAVFLLCASWTLASNEHIRIDIINNRLSRNARNCIDLIGHAFFLLPIAAVMVYLSWQFALSSAPRVDDVLPVLNRIGKLSPLTVLRQLLDLGEQSQNAGGLPQWPAKFLVPAGFALLFIQGISELIKRIAIMQGRIEDVHAAGGHQAAAEAEALRLKQELELEAQKRLAGGVPAASDSPARSS